jgi:hypothetical protein
MYVKRRKRDNECEYFIAKARPPTMFMDVKKRKRDNKCEYFTAKARPPIMFIYVERRERDNNLPCSENRYSTSGSKKLLTSVIVSFAAENEA